MRICTCPMCGPPTAAQPAGHSRAEEHLRGPTSPHGAPGAYSNGSTNSSSSSNGRTPLQVLILEASTLEASANARFTLKLRGLSGG